MNIYNIPRDIPKTHVTLSVYVYMRYVCTMLFSLSRVHVVCLSLLHMYNWACILGQWPCIAEINDIVLNILYCIHST